MLETIATGFGEHVGGGDGAHDVDGLVHRGHRTIAAVGGEVGEHHRGIGKRHQRLIPPNPACVWLENARLGAHDHSVRE